MPSPWPSTSPTDPIRTPPSTFLARQKRAGGRPYRVSRQKRQGRFRIGSVGDVEGEGGTRLCRHEACGPWRPRDRGEAGGGRVRAGGGRRQSKGGRRRGQGHLDVGGSLLLDQLNGAALLADHLPHVLVRHLEHLCHLERLCTCHACHLPYNVPHGQACCAPSPTLSPTDLVPRGLRNLHTQYAPGHRVSRR